jgi:uncharacterized membrane protein|tara:strand:- start:66480 stop:66944 length:465 start_codon:yes stop_codon:yes gene_type:complete
VDYLIIKWLHVLFATLLFGTGIGSAFYLLVTTLTRDVRAVSIVAGVVVMADFLFTATTVVLQPLTGFWLVYKIGLPLSISWLKWSIVLYVIAIACWLPVVVLQIKLRDLARQANRRGTELPPSYWRYFTQWVLLGIPAFFAFLAIFYLMVAKPV